jgi:hypothetical protein
VIPIVVIVATVVVLAAYGPLPGLLLFVACRFLMPLPFLTAHHRLSWLARWAWRRWRKTEVVSAGVLACASERGFAMVEHVPAWKGVGLFTRAWRHADDGRLEQLLAGYGRMSWWDRRQALKFALALLAVKGQRGCLSDFTSSPSTVIRLWTAALALDIRTSLGAIHPLADLGLSDFGTGRLVYRLPNSALDVEDFEKGKEYFEGLVGGPVVVSAEPGIPGAVRVQRIAGLPPKIELSAVEPWRAAVGMNQIALGVDAVGGEPLFVEFSDMQHTQVGGVSGYGKSVFLQSLIIQCLDLGDELSKVFIIDLKGTDFSRFEGNRVEIVYEFDRVVDLVEDLVALMHRRLTEMRGKGLVKWQKGRLVIIIDEFGQLMYWGVDPKSAKPADVKAAEAVQARLISNLCRLGMLGRAAGVTLVCATQKLTVDAIPSALRANLDWAVLFRTSRAMASSVFGGEADLQFDPPRLRRGQAVAFIDGETRYFQAFLPSESKHAA